MLIGTQLILLGKLIRSKNASVAAPKIAGIEIKNDNRVASVRENPISSAAVIVTPLREVPGISARH